MIFLIGGWAVIGLGIWFHVNQDSFLISYLLKDNPTNPIIVFEKLPFILIAVGIFISTTGFLGCCGTCAESICFLSFYSMLLVAAVVAEVSIALIIVFCHTQISHKIRTSLQYQVQRDYNRTAEHANSTALDIYRLTLAWDTMQVKMNCCGVSGPQDYMHSSWYNHSKDTDGMFVPPSCCTPKNNDNDNNNNHYHHHRRPMRIDTENLCQVEALVYLKNKNINESLGYLKTKGCQPVVGHWLYAYSPRVVLILILFIAVQLADLTLGCILMASVRKKQSEYWWCEDEDYE